jgi:hypothetical protein
MRTVLLGLAVALGLRVGDAHDGGAVAKSSVGPIDFAKVPRTIGKLPPLVAKVPLYGMFLFGPRGETRVWAVLDKSSASSAVYDVLHLDLNANGDLTDAGERFAAKLETIGDSKQCTFDVGRFVQPGTAAGAPRVHTGFSISWSPTWVSYHMNWSGGPITHGCYGPDGQSYGQFTADPATAPIVVPGHDLPFQFETWLSSTLVRGQENSFKVFVGNRGSVRGAFSSVDDKFLKPEEFVVATLLYKDRTGKEHSVRYELRERC